MNRRINKQWRSLLMVAVAAFIVPGASGAVFAQKTDKYPKPDFSAMEGYFEVVEHEYDFTGNSPALLSSLNRQKRRFRDIGTLPGEMLRVLR